MSTISGFATRRYIHIARSTSCTSRENLCQYVQRDVLLRCSKINRINGPLVFPKHPRHSVESIRFKSTIASNETIVKEKAALEYPKLNHIRSFPIIGSVVPELSGVPDTIRQAYKFWPELRRQYGDFYTIGLPSFGNPDDSYGTTYIITDPKEMVKVVRAAGSYPSGAVENLWVIRKWNETRGMHTRAINENGPEWKRIRTFMQTDLMHPESARGYVPGMIEAAKLASKGAPAMKKDLNKYLGLCAFDLFHTIFNGELTNTANPNAPKDPENVRFAITAADGLGTSIEMLTDIKETILGKVLGFETAKQRHCFKAFDEAWGIGQKKIEAFMRKKELGQLSESEHASYLANAIERQKEEGSNVTVREAQELAYTGLFAAVDTTSSVLGWNLFNVARFPDVQEKLYQELSHAVETIGDGSLTTEVLNRKNVPYLHAVIRESQRVTPVTTIYVNKRVASELNVNGVQLEKGTVVALDGFSIGMDPAIVDNPEKFEPERWLVNAVEQRKGTPKEIIDHPFFKGPFSQGARRCPGSRVASNEIQVMISQLVLDWEMKSSVSSLDDVNYKQRTTIELELPEIDFQPRQLA